MSTSDSPDLTPNDARRVVRLETNKVYNPVLSTEEVAKELGISPDKASELLEECNPVSGKPIGDTHVWW